MTELSHDQEVRTFVESHLDEDISSLGLRFSGRVNFSLPVVLEWIQALQKAKSKLPEWHSSRCLLTKRATEQASSERTATYKAASYSGTQLLNLCGGLGVDDVAFSRKFGKVVSLEADEDLSRISSENDQILHIENIERAATKAEDYLKENEDCFDLIYADPDRRDGQKRLVSLAECVPDIPGNWNTIQKISPQQLLKLSPLYPLELLQEELSGLYLLEIVSAGNEVKEVLAHFRTGYSGEVLRRAVELLPQQSFEAIPSGTSIPTSLKETESGYFYEVHPSISKAGIANEYAALTHLQTLIPNGIYQYGEEAVEGFFGRSFQLIAQGEYSRRKFDRYLSERKMDKANLASRYFKLSPLELKKLHKLKDGGEDYFFFFEDAGKRPRFVHGRKLAYNN